MQDLLYVPTPQATLDPSKDPVTPGVAAQNFFEDAGAFIVDDVIQPVVGIGSGTIGAVTEPLGDVLGDLGGIFGTAVGEVSGAIEGVTSAAGGIISSPLLLIGGVIVAIIIVIMVAT